MRVRLDYECKGWYQDFYTILPLDTDGKLAKLDAKMERLRKQHIEAKLYALDAQGQIDKETGYDGVVGAVQEAEPWQRWRIELA